MFRPESGDEENADISAEARRWCPDPIVREDGGRRPEWDASGVLLRLPMILLADMIEASVVFGVGFQYFR